jgi:pimeloyl-ACP methyl ester carboxylesterase
MTVGVVLIHGGMHGSWCWDPILPLVEAPVVAVDLPGRDGRPGDVHRITLDDWADSAAEQARLLDVDHLVIVGHSMGGVTALNSAKRLADRCLRLVFISGLVPDEGQTVANLYAPGQEAALFDDAGAFPLLSVEVLAAVLCNDLDQAVTDTIIPRLVKEPHLPFTTPFSHAGVPDVLCTYVRCLRDAALTREQQNTMTEHLRRAGRSVFEIESDTGHNAMFGDPHGIAEVINTAVAASSLGSAAP